MNQFTSIARGSRFLRNRGQSWLWAGFVALAFVGCISVGHEAEVGCLANATEPGCVAAAGKAAVHGAAGSGVGGSNVAGASVHPEVAGSGDLAGDNSGAGMQAVAGERGGT